jgi:GT2 family glycosyltransferase
MVEGLVSIFALTWERFESSQKTIQTNLQNIQGAATYEILICDQGSKDRRVVEYVSRIPNLVYHRKNSKNEGVGKSFNQLFLRSRGEFLCFMGSDLEMPPGWMREMLGYSKGITDSGMIGMDWGHSGVPPLTHQHGSFGHWLTPNLDRIFGPWIMRRAVVDKIGLFHEGFDVYGLEDSDFNARVNLAGFKSLYVPNNNFKCKHVGVGTADSGAYRAMKDASMAKNLPIFWQRYNNHYPNGLKEPLPEMREPL